MRNSSPRRPGTSRTWPPSRSSTTTSPPRTRRCAPSSTSTSPTFASTPGMGLIRSPPGYRRRPAILAAIGNAARRGLPVGRAGAALAGGRSRREDQHRDVPGPPVRAEEPGRVQGPREARAPARPAGEGETGPGGRAGPAGPRPRQRGRPVGRGGSCRGPAGRGRAGRSTGTRAVSPRPPTAPASAVTVQPADTGEDLPVTAKARAAARRDDIREVRDHLAQVRDAERDRIGAESSLGKAPADDGELREVLPRGR